jgi:hypothetical protein
MEDSNRRLRAEARRQGAILHKTTLRPRETDLTPIKGVEAISLVASLTRESWSLAGREYPKYTRQEIPCRLVPGRLT